MFTILKRSMSSMTYSSLCIPEDIAERGLEDVPNFYYRDDGLRLWDIIHRYRRQLTVLGLRGIHSGHELDFRTGYAFHLHLQGKKVIIQIKCVSFDRNNLNN